MLIQSALYYPYIHIRSEAWLKGAALYWKSMDRIVPYDYPTNDSPTVRILQDELGFLNNRQPGQSAVEASQLFLDLLVDRGPEIRERLRVQPPVGKLRNDFMHPNDGGITDNGTIGYIFAEKMTSALLEALTEHGLAYAGPHDLSAHGRPSMARYKSWIGMDSRLAAAYMTVLARLAANRFDLRPVTDVSLAHLAMDGLTVDAIADTILGIAPESRLEDRNNRRQRIALLAVQSVIPRSLGLVSAEEIVRFRKRHEDLLGAFQASVAQAVSELETLPADVEAHVVRDRLIEATNRHLVGPKIDLERGLSLFGLEPINNVILVSLATAGIFVGGPANPITGNATGAAVTLATLSGVERVRRRALRRANGAGNYLLALEEGLTPAGLLRRQVRSIVGG